MMFTEDFMLTSFKSITLKLVASRVLVRLFHIQFKWLHSGLVRTIFAQGQVNLLHLLPYRQL